MVTSSLPARVFRELDEPVLIEIRPSGTASDADTKALFTTSDVDLDDVIFAIEKPLLCIVADGLEKMATTCDNCFAFYRKKADSDGEVTLEANDWVPKNKFGAIELLACPDCKLMHYCNDYCRDLAWEHHHKYECETFASTGEDQEYGYTPTHTHTWRYALRILLLHKNGCISKEEWDEYLSVKTGQTHHFENPDLAKKYSHMATQLMAESKTTLEYEQVLHIVCIALSSSMAMRLTNFRGIGATYSLYNPESVEAGYCFDPFLNLLTNDCGDPNTYCYFDGVQFICKALKCIKKDTELTTRLVFEPRDYKLRQEKLMKRNIDCKCNLCQKGAYGRGGVARKRMLMITCDIYPALEDWETYEKKLKADYRTASMMMAGYDWKAPALRWVYMQIFFGEMYRFEAAPPGMLPLLTYKAILKLLLSIYYFIDPVTDYRPLPNEKLDVLYHLINFLLRSKIEPIFWKYNDTKPILLLCCGLQKIFQEGVLRWRQSATYDSRIIEFYAVETVKVMEQEPRWYSKVNEEEFGMHMNTLLDWVGLDKKPVGELVEELSTGQ